LHEASGCDASAEKQRNVAYAVTTAEVSNVPCGAMRVHETIVSSTVATNVCAPREYR
jgi:hypothetical protein